MVEEIKIFGAALDALPSIERVNLKRAYLHYMRNRSPIEGKWQDPYDFVKGLTERSVLNNRIRWSGKIPIPSWLTPKPQKGDTSRLSVENLLNFLETDGCWSYALMIADSIRREFDRVMPVMIGVDHSLTGGSIMALAERYPNLNVVIIDAHFDVLGPERFYEGSQLNYYGCGNFLDHLLKRKVIAPKNLWILGVQDEMSRELMGESTIRQGMDLNTASLKEWMKKGVHVIFKREVQAIDFQVDLDGPTYLSIDMDVGSMSSIYSARFMNSYGLNPAEFLQLLRKVFRWIRSSHCPLAGLDIMEFDIHFWEVIREKGMDDRTEVIVKEIFRLFVNRN